MALLMNLTAGAPVDLAAPFRISTNGRVRPHLTATSNQLQLKRTGKHVAQGQCSSLRQSSSFLSAFKMGQAASQSSVEVARRRTGVCVVATAGVAMKSGAQKLQLQELPSWEELADATKHALAGSNLLETDKKVVLYRDTNAWCPFCARVWFAMLEKGIPYETVLVNITGEKPQWFKDLVPTGLVPAITIDGELTYESLEILPKLEEAFPERPLVPPGKEEQAKALIQKLSEITGASNLFGWLMNSDASKEEELKEKALQTYVAFEQLLEESGGPFFMGEFSMVDTAYITPLEGTSYRAAAMKKTFVRGNPRFPRLTAWFEALDERPAYQAMKSDADSSVRLMSYFFARQAAAGSARTLPEMDAAELARLTGHVQTEGGALYAAARMSQNHERVVEDAGRGKLVLAALGRDLDALTWTPGGRAVGELEALGAGAAAAVEGHLRLVCVALAVDDQLELRGIPKGTRVADLVAAVEGLLPAGGTLEAAVGVAAVAHMEDRVCVPRDMTAGAKVRFVAIIRELKAALQKRIAAA